MAKNERNNPFLMSIAIEIVFPSSMLNIATTWVHVHGYVHMAICACLYAQEHNHLQVHMHIYTTMIVYIYIVTFTHYIVYVIRNDCVCGSSMCRLLQLVLVLI